MYCRCSGHDMKKIIIAEFQDLGGFIMRNFEAIAVISFSTLFIVLKYYHSLNSAWGNSLLYFIILPLVTIICVLRKNPLDFGLRLGNHRLWSMYVLIFLLLAVPILYYSSDIDSVRKYYSSRHLDFFQYSVHKGVYLLGLEFFFRGFMLFGLKEQFREGSIIIQMVPFTILHIGKPEVEVVGCIITGTLFGYIAYRGNSFWPAFIIHLAVNIANKFFVNF